MRRVASALLVLAVTAGCAVGAEDDAHRVDLTVAAGVLDGPAAATGEHGADTVALSVYLVRDNRLVHVTREAPPAESQVAAVVTAAVTGPSAAEASAGMWSAIPPATSVRAVQVSNGLARIDLSSDLAAIGGRDEILAVAQIVLSVTSLPEADSVTFLLEGAATSVPRPDGVLAAGPFTAGDYVELAG